MNEALMVTDLQTASVSSDLTPRRLLASFRAKRRWIIFVPISAGLLAAAITLIMRPVFTASTTFIAPQQGQSAASSALAAIGSLASLAGSTSGIRNSADQVVALLQSANVSNSIIDKFDLMRVYEAEFRVDARQKLAKHVRIAVGKKDGLLNIEVEDHDPARAAAIANRYVDELRRLNSSLAITEAQQRRVFFQQQLAQSKDSLARAQQALQASGFSAGALKVEPKAAAESYARLKAESVTAELRLRALRASLSDETPEVRQQQALLAGLQAQLSKSEQAQDTPPGPDYISKYRDFKYQEALFEVYARQFELARVDESKEGALIQVVDVATPPEKKSGPKRTLIVLGASAAALLLTLLTIWIRAGFGAETVLPGDGSPGGP